METEMLGIILGAVLPVYTSVSLYQKIGRYDEIVEEFKKLQGNSVSRKTVGAEPCRITP